jgi:hypothetical protein
LLIWWKSAMNLSFFLSFCDFPYALQRL